jgi:hypothetical protein
MRFSHSTSGASRRAVRAAGAKDRRSRSALRGSKPNENGPATPIPAAA